LPGTHAALLTILNPAHLGPVQWALAALGAFAVGHSKTGVGGLGILFVACFALVFPSSKQATGVVLPLLAFGDVVAVMSYRSHAQWRFLWKLFPSAAVGVVLGFLALGRISDHSTKTMVGGIICSLAALSYYLRRRSAVNDERVAALSWLFAPFIGILAGFLTLIANAAGPIMAIYFVSMRLPKLQYVGTAAVFFMLLNLFKVPFMVQLGLITDRSFELNLLLLPAVLLGALGGRWLLPHVNQDLFDDLVLSLSALAGLLMLL
jgi:uncharacterized membrane protein YfcA